MCKEEVCVRQNLDLQARALSSNSKVQALACQQWKWASSREQLGFALEMRWRGQISKGSSEWNHCTSPALKGAKWGGSGSWSVCIQISSLYKVFWARPSGLKAPGLHLDLLEGLQFLSCLRAPRGSLEGSWERRGGPEYSAATWLWIRERNIVFVVYVAMLCWDCLIFRDSETSSSVLHKFLVHRSSDATLQKKKKRYRLLGCRTKKTTSLCKNANFLLSVVFVRVFIWSYDV